MDAEELASLVEELDLRLERLRVLFDQYFQGIEKIPPNIVQKDVDRRIWILRREKIRNTGTRFRFQQIVQRYNTFSSFWMRTCREIENGTYKRDVLRAKKKFGEQGRRLPTNVRKSEPPPSIDVQVDVDMEPIDELDLIEDFEEITEIDEPLDDALRAYSHDTTKMKAGPPMTPAPSPPPAAPKAQAHPFAKQQPAPVAQQPAPAAKPAAAAAPQHPFAKQQPAATPKPAAAKPAPAEAPPPSMRPSINPSVPKILASKVNNDDDLDDMLDAALGTSSPPRAPSATPAPVPAQRAQQPAHPFAARAAPPSAPQPSAPKPSAPQPSASKPSAPQPSPPSAPTSSQQRPAPSTPRVSAPGSNGLRASSPSVVSDEYRAVYSKYVEAKRANGESTAGVTYESLAKNLRDTSEKLKQKSGGRAIDFDVVVKDGKTILKPVVK